MRKLLEDLRQSVGSVIGAIRMVNPFGGGPDVIADRRAMFGDDPENDPRRMDYDPDRPVHRQP